MPTSIGPVVVKQLAKAMGVVCYEAVHEGIPPPRVAIRSCAASIRNNPRWRSAFSTEARAANPSSIRPWCRSLSLASSRWRPPIW